MHECMTCAADHVARSLPSLTPPNPLPMPIKAQAQGQHAGVASLVSSARSKRARSHPHTHTHTHTGNFPGVWLPPAPGNPCVVGETDTPSHMCSDPAVRTGCGTASAAPLASATCILPSAPDPEMLVHTMQPVESPAVTHLHLSSI
jgi:hypothetical protein